jgi:hypothetical protein
MPLLTSEDIDNARSLGAAVQDLVGDQDGNQPLHPDVLDSLRFWLDNQSESLGPVLKGHGAFADEDMANLIQAMNHPDFTSIEWRSFADVLFHEYMGRAVGPETNRALYP